MIDLQDASIERGEFKLSNLSMKIDKGQLALLTGRTGSGKSTILETICGLHSLIQGTLSLRQQLASDLPMAARRIGWLPQSSALFPNLTVRDQLALPLKARRWSQTLQADRFAELSASLEIDDLIDRYPENLSGGEARRVALARAVSFGPDILCLDEPLVSLDKDTQDIVGRFLEAQHRSGTTILLISHQPGPMLKFADVSWALVEGRLQKT